MGRNGVSEEKESNGEYVTDFSAANPLLQPTYFAVSSVLSVAGLSAGWISRYASSTAGEVVGRVNVMQVDTSILFPNFTDNTLISFSLCS